MPGPTKGTEQRQRAMHNEIINQLSAYLDGELSPDERARIDAHVAGVRCRAAPCSTISRRSWSPRRTTRAKRRSRDLWAGIQQGISGAKEVPLSPSPVDRRPSPVQPGPVDRRLPRLRGDRRWLGVRRAQAADDGHRSRRRRSPVNPSPVDRSPSPSDHQRFHARRRSLRRGGGRPRAGALRGPRPARPQDAQGHRRQPADHRPGHRRSAFGDRGRSRQLPTCVRRSPRTCGGSWTSSARPPT